MNKNTIVQIIMGIAIAVLFMMQTSEKETTSAQSDKTVPVDSVNNEVKDSTTVVDIDTAKWSIREGHNAKLAFYSPKKVVELSPYLKRKQQALLAHRERYERNMISLQQELDQFQKEKYAEAAELEKRKMLVPATQQRIQQELSLKVNELTQREKSLEKELRNHSMDYQNEASKIVEVAIEKLNEVAKWDYVLSDNEEFNIVVPLNKDFDISKELSEVINQKYK